MLKQLATALLAFPLGLQLFLGGFLLQSAHAEELPLVIEETTPEPEVVEPYLIISAVQITGGTGKTQEDYIELFNPTSVPFDLNGYRLVKRTAANTTDSLIISWTQSTIVQPHHFWLWANSGFFSISVAPDSVSSGTLADNNGIALRNGPNDTGEILDSLTWGSTANGFESMNLQNPSADQSLVRSDLFTIDSSFELQPSSPRNCTIEQLPPAPEQDPEQDPGEVDPPIITDPPIESDPPTENNPPTETEPEPEQIDIKITELLPNPAGVDTGAEKVELFNAGSAVVNLEGTILDDVGPSDPLSTNAYTLPDLEIEPNEYIAVTIPAGAFSLNNTIGDVVTLFHVDGAPIDSVSYTGTTPEAKSYSKFSEEQWAWVNPTFGQSNGTLPDTEEDEEDEDSNEQPEDFGEYNNSGLQISELYPNPASGNKEYIELYNSSETEVAQLAVVSLVIGEKLKLLPAAELDPGEYYVIEQGNLPAQLRNTGQTVKILEDDTVLDEAVYSTATKGASYARFEDGFLWTVALTKGKDNVLELPEETKKSAPAPKQTVAKKAATKAKTTAKASSASKANAKPMVAGAAKKTDTTAATNNSSTNSLDPNPPSKSKEPIAKVIAMGAAAAAAGVVALYKLVFSTGE